ncbi:MAG: succinate dehydrogenase, hydrophobic membrane anchor protein [Gammaproteobacteria bacterium]
MSQYAHGFRAWIVQRLSAIYLLLFFVISLVWFIQSPTITFDVWLATLKSPISIILIALFFLAVFIHAWVGVRDIVIDYVHPFVLRLVLLSFILLFIFGLGVSVVLILASVYIR